MANQKRSKSQNWGAVNPTVGTQTQRVSTPRDLCTVDRTKGPVINNEEGQQHGKIGGPKLFAPHPLSRQGTTFRAPPSLSKVRNSLHSSSIWLKRLALMLKIPQNLLCLPFSMAYFFCTPLFIEVKLHLVRYHFCRHPSPYL